MAASSEQTEQHWHPSGYLPYDPLSNGQDDFDSMMSNTKSITGTGTDFYSPSLTSRRYALVGVAFSSVISCCCITAGVFILATHGVSQVTPLVSLDAASSTLPSEIWSLMLNLLVTICTESTGFVHGISLRSALASESRLRFNTNLRLLTAARGWRNPNGALRNGIMAILLIISYTSSSLVVFINHILPYNGPNTLFLAIAGLPLLVLGVALFLQVVIALSGMRAVKILTWSASPFDLTAALVHHTQLTPVPIRCMRCVSDLDMYGGPAKPSETQPSAWHAHPNIQKVVIFLWGTVAACAGWAALIMYIWDKYTGARWISAALTIQSWSFFPNATQSNYISYVIPGVNIQWWILVFANMAAVQGPLTLGLHCSELIANVIRDERQWRCATGRKGLQTATNPLKAAFTNPLSLVLFIVKPFLHWMFGLSFVVDNIIYEGTVEALPIQIFSAHIWNLCFALFIFACFFTLVSLRRPRGPQPATYGHLQTLANLVDEWSPVMWWGHKADESPYCHAGTSDHPLPHVKMNCVYAGSCVESTASVS
ncbi:hypothetical protein EDB19DRAFT_453089 [Suillus lakei]|nr:hypothetical protein EDB19DRAFT_453089 [Suillus lakei]